MGINDNNLGPIYKKGDKKHCYRGVTILNTLTDVYEQMLEQKLRKFVGTMLTDSQNGFRKGNYNIWGSH